MYHLWSDLVFIYRIYLYSQVMKLYINTFYKEEYEVREVCHMKVITWYVFVYNLAVMTLASSASTWPYFGIWSVSCLQNYSRYVPSITLHLHVYVTVTLVSSALWWRTQSTDDNYTFWREISYGAKPHRWMSSAFWRRRENLTTTTTWTLYTPI